VKKAVNGARLRRRFFFLIFPLFLVISHPPGACAVLWVLSFFFASFILNNMPANVLFILAPWSELAGAAVKALDRLSKKE
jgi:hypothetical protein